MLSRSQTVVRSSIAHVERIAFSPENNAIIFVDFHFQKLGCFERALQSFDRKRRRMTSILSEVLEEEECLLPYALWRFCEFLLRVTVDLQKKHRLQMEHGF